MHFHEPFRGGSDSGPIVVVMSRWTLILLFTIAAVSGYLAFGVEVTSRSALLDGIFVGSVLLFLAAFVREVGRRLEESADPGTNSKSHGGESRAHS